MHMKLVIVFVLLGVVSSSLSSDWIKFKRDYNKQYKSLAEEIERKQIFLENVNLIRNYKRLYPNATFTVGINHLADRRTEELVSKSKRYIEPSADNVAFVDSSMYLPDSLDWRTKGVVSSVRNEGLLGDVEAIAVVEVIETLHAIQTGHLQLGSIPRVADCCPQPVDPFQCVSKLGGICLAADYPKSTGQCVPNACKPFASFDKLMRLKGQNENLMKTWIQNSTLFAGIDASKASFQMYQSGIYNDQTCSKTTIDHALQIVGYGQTSAGELYWICKNSWGVSWGEVGYIRILRGKNVCGIATDVIQVA